MVCSFVLTYVRILLVDANCSRNTDESRELTPGRETRLRKNTINSICVSIVNATKNPTPEFDSFRSDEMGSLSKWIRHSLQTTLRQMRSETPLKISRNLPNPFISSRNRTTSGREPNPWLSLWRRTNIERGLTCNFNRIVCARAHTNIPIYLLRKPRNTLRAVARGKLSDLFWRLYRFNDSSWKPRIAYRTFACHLHRRNVMSASILNRNRCVIEDFRKHIKFTYKDKIARLNYGGRNHSVMSLFKYHFTSRARQNKWRRCLRPRYATYTIKRVHAMRE